MLRTGYGFRPNAADGPRNDKLQGPIGTKDRFVAEVIPDARGVIRNRFPFQ